MQKKLTAFCTVLLLIMLLTVSASAAAPHFEDVSADTPFADSILYLADCGITNGTDSHLFSPDAPITTHQWAVMLCRAYGLDRTGAKRHQAGASKEVDGSNGDFRI